MDTLHTFPGLEPVLTTSDPAAHLGVPVQTIHDLRHAHRGSRGFRVGREMRYRLSEVQHWVEALESQDRAVDSVKDARLGPGATASKSESRHRVSKCGPPDYPQG